MNEIKKTKLNFKSFKLKIISIKNNNSELFKNNSSLYGLLELQNAFSINSSLNMFSDL